MKTSTNEAELCTYAWKKAVRNTNTLEKDTERETWGYGRMKRQRLQWFKLGAIREGLSSLWCSSSIFSFLTTSLSGNLSRPHELIRFFFSGFVFNSWWWWWCDVDAARLWIFIVDIMTTFSCKTLWFFQNTIFIHHHKVMHFPLGQLEWLLLKTAGYGGFGVLSFPVFLRWGGRKKK